MRILFLLFLISQNIWATPQFSKRGSDFVIQDAQCKNVENEIQALAGWLQNTDGKSCDSKQISKEIGPPCVAKVNSCLPEHVIKYHGVTPEFNGPNCWNLSLVMAGLNKHLRYSTPDEMSLLMGPPLCRSLKKNEAREAGDVIAIRTPQGEEVHGLIYVSPSLVYSKNGFNKMSPYELQSSERVMSFYQVPKKESCRANQSNDSSCWNLQNVYRCQKLDDYLSKVQAEGIYDEDIKALKYLESAECTLSEKLFNRQPLSSEAMGNLKDVAKALSAYGKGELARGDWKNDTKKTFHLSLLRARLFALSDQMDMLPSAAGEQKEMMEMMQAFRSASDDYKNKDNGL